MSVGPLAQGGVGSKQPLLIWHSDVGGKQRAEHREEDQLLPSARGETDQGRSFLARRTVNSKLKEFSRATAMAHLRNISTETHPQRAWTTAPRRCGERRWLAGSQPQGRDACAGVHPQRRFLP